MGADIAQVEWECWKTGNYIQLPGFSVMSSPCVYSRPAPMYNESSILPSILLDKNMYQVDVSKWRLV